MLRSPSIKNAGWIGAILLLVGMSSGAGFAQDQSPPQTVIEGPAGISIVVRMQGPYDAAVPLQIVCYFQHTETSDSKLFGAPIDLDKRLGGLIGNLRSRNEFRGEGFETLLLQSPPKTISAQQLLLLGLGSESELSLERLEGIGRTSLREAARAGASTVAFAPMIRDAENETLSAADVETAVICGMLMAYDTERKLQSQGLAKPYELKTWIVEAGPDFYKQTIEGVKKGIADAGTKLKSRPIAPYSTFTTPAK